MLQDNFKKLKPLLKKTGLDQHVFKEWIYRDKALVLDFNYRGVKFSFDITPLADGRFALDIVERNHSSGFTVTTTPDKKAPLGESASLEEAWGRLHNRAIRLFSEVDLHFDIDQTPFEIASTPSVNTVGTATSHPPTKPQTIGVMTLPLNANYGGNLQTFALMEALKKLGHKPVFINLRHPTRQDPAAASDLPLMSDTVGLPASVANTAFIDSYLQPITRAFSTPAQLARNIDALGLDTVIVGSDQVWRAQYARTLLTNFYFFGFLPKDSKVKRISYAASFGVPEWKFSDEQTRKAAQLVKLFDGVSVREDVAVDLCKTHLGVEPHHVLDPTLLLAPEDYQPVLSTAPRDRKAGQLLAYILDVTEDKKSAIGKLSQALSRPAYGTNALPFADGAQAEGAKEDKSVQGWLAAFDDAAFVVTDSFHGVAFSILFNKPFLAYANPGRGMARFTSILKMVGLEDRLVQKSSEINIGTMTRPINWDAVNDKLAMFRDRSFQFLERSLSDRDDAAGPSTSPNAVNKGRPASVASRSEAISPNSGGPVSAANPLGVLCSGCGVCVSEANGGLKMDWDKDGFLSPQATGQPIPATAVRVCPFNPHPEDEVRDEDALAEIFLTEAERHHPQGGHYKNCYVGYSKEYRPTASSGGVATHVFEKLLTLGEVDYVFIVLDDGDKGYRYRIFNKASEITKTSKTRYYPVTLEELFPIMEQIKGRIAVSGVACFIKAIRLKQHYHPELREKFPFLVGIICGGLKSRHYTDFLAQSAGVKGNYTGPQYRVKNAESTASDYSFSATDGNQRTHTVRMQKLGDMWGTGLFKARACDFCTDVMTELSDISLGDAWLPEYRSDGMGHSIIVTRSELAEKIIQDGLRDAELVVKEIPMEKALSSQRAGLQHKQNAVHFRAWMGENIYKVPVPYIRPRLKKDISVAEAFVQILRERTRFESLRVWNETKDRAKFVKRMRSTLRRLNNVTTARTKGQVNSTAYIRAMTSVSQSAVGSPIRRYPMGRWLMQKIKRHEISSDETRELLSICGRKDN